MISLINGATTMNYNLTQEVKAASKAGFEGGEIWWDKAKKYLEEHSISEMKTLLSANDFKPYAICPFLVSPFRRTEELRAEFIKALNVASGIGCGLLTICPDFQPINMTHGQAVKMLVDEFKWYSIQAKKLNIRLAIEPIGRHTLVAGPDDALWIIRLAGDPDNLGILIDTFHYMRSQISIEELNRIPPEKLFIVHVNDSEYGAIDELNDSNRLFPTEGYIDLRATMRVLKALQYDGAYSVEVFRPEYWALPIEEITDRAYRSLRKLMKLVE